MGTGEPKRLLGSSAPELNDKRRRVNESSKQKKIDQFFGQAGNVSPGSLSTRHDLAMTRHATGTLPEMRCKETSESAAEESLGLTKDAQRHSEQSRNVSAESLDAKIEAVAQEAGVFDSCMYTEEVNHMLAIVLKDESFLFEQSELDRFSTYTELEEDAKRLFVRLWMRKHRWIRMDKVNYTRHIRETDQAVRILVEKGFLVNEIHDAATALELLSLEELKVFAKEIHVVPKIAKTRASYLNALREHFAAATSGDDDKGGVQAITERIGLCVKLETRTYELFQRLYLVYYRATDLTRSNSIADAILSRLSRRNYPVYEYGRSHVWKTRQDLIAYEEALLRQRQFDQCLEQSSTERRSQLSDSTDREKALLEECWTLCETILALWENMVQQFCAFDDHYYRRRFDAGWVYTRMLEHGTRVLAKLHEYDTEALILDKLIHQYVYRLGKRGRWYDRLALVQSNYLKSLPERQRKKAALQTCIQAIQDPNVHQIHLHGLYRRIGRLELDLRIPRREQHDFSHVILRKPKTRTFHGKRISGSITGMKSVWEGADGGSVSVEQVALDHYALKGYKGIHSENGIVTMLFMLLFWDIVFAPVPGVLETPYQSQPLDLGTDAFYSGRLDLIRDRLQLLSDGDNKHYLDILRSVDERERLRQTVCTGVNWRYELQDLLQIAECIGPIPLSALCKLLAEEFGYRASGMPDLCCWNYDKKECFFAEVKGPGDKLSETQNLWIDTLSGIGIAIEVCHVTATEHHNDVSV